MEKTRVSYSQYSMWNSCPHKWKLTYIDNIRRDTPSIHLAFGTAMHYTIQMYLTVLYQGGASQASQLDLKEILKEALDKEYKKYRDIYEATYLAENVDVEKRNILLDAEFEKHLSKNDMVEFFYDGVKILDYFAKHRVEFFNSVDEVLLGIEYKLDEPLKENLNFIGYVDILIKNKKTGRVRIIDLKTSTKGWGSYKKNDSATTDQLILYKAMYSKKLNIEPKLIDVEFVILKRKLYEDIPYKQKRILKFVPAAGTPTMNKTIQRFDYFIDSCFDAVGNKKIDAIYPKIATDSNCRYCDFANSPEHCDRKN